MSDDVTAPVGRDLGSNYLSPEQDARRALLCQAAGEYAHRWGFAVIPVRWITDDGVCSCNQGAECASPGKHPVHQEWPEVSTTDPAAAAYWWRPAPEEALPAEWWPLANIGIVTGRRSGVFVLDVDPGPAGADDGGDATLARYEARYSPVPETRIHHTGSGGVHYIFAHPGFDVRNNARTALGKGLDIRGENGFVVAPPSVSAKGSYVLNEAQDITPAPAPGWLLELLRSYDRDQNGESIAGPEPQAAVGASRRYTEAALRAEAERMRSAGPGERNNTLNECAFSLGTLGGAGLLEESVAYQALKEAAQDAGLAAGEIRATFMSGWKAGLKDPRNVQWRGMETTWPVRGRTQFGLADRMVDHWGDRLRWCPEHATWMLYGQGVWVMGSKDAGDWYAQAMIRALPDTEGMSYEEDAGEGEDGTQLPSPREMFIEWATKQQTAQSVRAASRLSTGLALMRMSNGTFDLDPMKLNVQNGVIDLATGQFLDHDPEMRMTLQAHAWYRPGETAPQWEEFLRRVQPDPEMRAYLQRVAGYCATGLTTEQAMFLWHGAGANGKSVAQAVLAHILGTYAQTLPVSTLMASTMDDRIPNDVARMKGRRFLVASETKQGKALDEQRLKQLTGGDSISARFMRAEWFDFKPEGKIQLTTNHLPRMSDDPATWRRIHLITWPVVIPEHERDGFLQQRLIDEESSGILNWIIQGALAWQQEGLNPPTGVLQAKEDYRVEEDIVGQFVEAMLDLVDPMPKAARRSTAEIHAAFQGWASAEGLGKDGQLGQKALTSRLQKHGHKYLRTGGWAGFPGLQVSSVFGA